MIPPTATPQRIPRRILVIEDHASTAEVLERLLARKGHQVWTAHTCQQAREICSTQPVEVLVCDIGLPDGNGWRLLKDLKLTQSVKGIVLSSHDQPEDLEKSRKAGFDAHLSKPVDMAELDRALVDIFIS